MLKFIINGSFNPLQNYSYLSIILLIYVARFGLFIRNQRRQLDSAIKIDTQQYGINSIMKEACESPSKRTT